MGYSRRFNLCFNRNFLRKMLFCISLKQSNTRSKSEIHAVLLDLSKVFDPLSHKIPIEKLQSSLFSPSAIQLVELFYPCQQCVEWIKDQRQFRDMFEKDQRRTFCFHWMFKGDASLSCTHRIRSRRHCNFEHAK